jgi:hypothetical protein
MYDAIATSTDGSTRATEVKLQRWKGQRSASWCELQVNRLTVKLSTIIGCPCVVPWKGARDRVVAEAS